MLNVLIIGAGNIGAGISTSGAVLSHAHAFQRTKGFQLAGFVDTDLSRAGAACKQWGGEAFHSVADAVTRRRIDLACIAVPDDAHYDVIMQAIDVNIPCLVLEKPLAKTLSQATEIVDRLDKNGNVKTIVNYTRRYVPEFQDIKKEIDAKLYGAFVKGVFYYGKGFLHNGSHGANLIRYWLGDVCAVYPRGKIYDCYEDDPTYSLTMELTQGGYIEVMGIDQRLFTIFEMDLLFEKGKIRMTDLGRSIEVFSVTEDSVYSGYQTLASKKQINTSMGTALSSMAQHTLEVCNGEQGPICDARDALRDMEICLLERI